MTKRAVVFISVFGAGLAFAAATLPSAVRAQSADLALCDRVAADPSDPDKPAQVRGATQIDAADIPLAIKYCKAASSGSRRAMYALGRAYAASQKQPEAIAAYRKAADKGSTSAMVEMGVAYATGNGVERDEAKARTLFERAANAGNARGYTNLAAMGGGTAYSDPVQMRAMLSKSAESNSAEAQYQLGMMLADGVGGPRDEAGARALFEKAAAQNHPGAMVRAGLFAKNGRGGPQDKAAAKSYFERAAALGNEEAKTELQRVDCSFALKDKSGRVFGCF